VRRFQDRLLAWFERHKRALPWRSEPSPYRVWVAEIMLQQTRVTTALPYFERFLKRFPDVQALAFASEPDILKYWAGLGYYQRARHLRCAARKIVLELGGAFPESLEEIRQLPGVGRYTAAAISSIAFHQPEPVVDGNVRRIIRRLLGVTDAPEEFFWQQARSWLVEDRASDFNQAFMELGALVCVPSHPHCGSCPVKSLCETGVHGLTPPAMPAAARAKETVEVVMLALESSGRIALTRQPGLDFIPGKWGLPLQVLPKGRQPDSAAKSLARSVLGRTPPLHYVRCLRHAITRRHILAHVYEASIEPAMPCFRDGHTFSWIPRATARRLLTSSLFLKGLENR
ncbi:MAG: A/G-specific adenine glycosylase, partial [Acidobacteriota bacterium]